MPCRVPGNPTGHHGFPCTRCAASATEFSALKEAGFGVEHARIVDVSGRCPGFVTTPAFPRARRDRPPPNTREGHPRTRRRDRAAGQECLAPSEPARDLRLRDRVNQTGIRDHAEPVLRQLEPSGPVVRIQGILRHALALFRIGPVLVWLIHRASSFTKPHAARDGALKSHCSLSRHPMPLRHSSACPENRTPSLRVGHLKCSILNTCTCIKLNTWFCSLFLKKDMEIVRPLR
jgi:hypothetical protein